MLPQIIPEPNHEKENKKDQLQETEEEDEKTEECQSKEVKPALPDHEVEEEETDAMDLIKTELAPIQDSEKKAAVGEELVHDITNKPLDTTQSALELSQLFTDILVEYVSHIHTYIHTI